MKLKRKEVENSIITDRYSLYLGDCLEVLRSLPSESVDSCVTDPPYNLSFMGSEWDTFKVEKTAKSAGGFGKDSPTNENAYAAARVRYGKERDAALAYQQWCEAWAREVYRVLKPGGFLLAFGGPRTYHRLSCGIEDAGFEIRDSIAWLTGQGFPKSQNVGKDIESKTGSKEWEGFGTALKPGHEKIICATKPLDIGAELYRLEIQLCLLLPVNVAVENFGLSQRDYREAESVFAQWIAEQKSSIQVDLLDRMDTLQLKLTVNLCLNIVILWKSIWEEVSNLLNMSTIETEINLITELRTLKSYLSATTPRNILDYVIKRNGKQSNVLNVEKSLNAVKLRLSGIQEPTALENAIGTHSVIVARKPFKGTVSGNVLKHGTGAMNIDACRIGRDEKDVPGWHKSGARGSKGYLGSDTYKIRDMSPEEIQERIGNKGRWPSNTIFSHLEECELVGEKRVGSGESGVVEFEQPNIRGNNFNRSKGKQKSLGMKYGKETVEVYNCAPGCPVAELDRQISGGSRFFYVCKPSKKERDWGLDFLFEKVYVHWQTANGTSGKPSSISEGRNTQRKNLHPTLKSVTLMRYLQRLVTPPDGITLDPFAGSFTSGIAAAWEGFRFIGIEKSEEYWIYRVRVEAAYRSLFAYFKEGNYD